MIDLSAHPRCRSYLGALKVSLSEPGLSEYHAALIVADSFRDEDLTRFGKVNFWTMGGRECLDGMEAFLAQRRKGKTPRLPKPDFERLKAFLGAQGIKTSALKGDDAFWNAAIKLWPDHIERTENATLAGLLHQISSIPKKQRRAIARQNRAAVSAASGDHQSLQRVNELGEAA